MLDTRQLLERLDTRQPANPLAATGFGDLDELTGGLLPGKVWVVVGGVGEGKTTLLTQWTVTVATGGHPVQLVCPREPAAVIAARMLSQLARIPLSHLVGDHHGTPDPSRLLRARDRLAGLPLTVVTSEVRAFTPETDVREPGPDSAVVLDDADQIAGLDPASVERFASAGHLVIVGLPREKVLNGPGEWAPLHAQWCRVADVVLEVRHRALPQASVGAGSRYRPPELRPGEGDLVVHRNRRGPIRTVQVAFQGHYARFVDLRP